jgi:hypothetical protein
VPFTIAKKWLISIPFKVALSILRVYSRKDFIKLMKYCIKNKFIFLFISSVTKAISNDEIVFKDEQTKDILNELCILLNTFNHEITQLIDTAKKSKCLFIKIPAIPLDLTRDIDVVSYDSSLMNIRSRFFNIYFDVYSLSRVKKQLNLCNVSHLKESRMLQTRELLYLAIKDGFKVETKKVTVQGLNELIDYGLILNNIVENGFILYYDYLNLRRYMNILRDCVVAKRLNCYFTKFSSPIKIYPSLLLGSINLSALTRFIKMILDTNYTPVYGNMIEYVRKVASDLGLKKLAGSLFE